MTPPNPTNLPRSRSHRVLTISRCCCDQRLGNTVGYHVALTAQLNVCIEQDIICGLQ